MLRIIATYQLGHETGAAYMLELRGRLEGDWVDELRHAWWGLRDVIADVPVSLALSEVEFVDTAGQTLLAEMRRGGVDLARDAAGPQPTMTRPLTTTRSCGAHVAALRTCPGRQPSAGIGDRLHSWPDGARMLTPPVGSGSACA